MDPQQQSLRQFRCPVCGESNFEFGQVHFGLYSPGNGEFWNMPRSLMTPKPMIARACLN